MACPLGVVRVITKENMSGITVIVFCLRKRGEMVQQQPIGVEQQRPQSVFDGQVVNLENPSVGYVVGGESMVSNKFKKILILNLLFRVPQSPWIPLQETCLNTPRETAYSSVSTATQTSCSWSVLWERIWSAVIVTISEMHSMKACNSRHHRQRVVNEEMIHRAGSTHTVPHDIPLQSNRHSK